MCPTDSVSPNAPPSRDAIAVQLERLLAHSAFRKSERCSKLLRYLVEQSLSDRDFRPKERTLAVEVFGRSPEFDSGSDPIVRTTATEIRKRLGSYYHETGSAEVFIELPTGSYRPTFRSATSTFAPPSIAQSRVPSPGIVGPSRSAIVACLVATIAIIAGSSEKPQHAAESNSTRFWRPFLSSSHRILICPSSANASVQIPREETFSPSEGSWRTVALSTPMITMADSKAVWRVLSVLESAHKNVLLRTSDRVQPHDLQDGPAILIGGPSNPWSRGLLSHLRFQVGPEDSRTVRITDEWAPSDDRWSIDRSSLKNAVGRAFMIISRVTDPQTNNTVMDISGVGLHSAGAAGEFISRPAYLNSLGAAISDCNNNLQLVLSTHYKNGEVDAPKVEAVYCW
jgi:hypothetical protein